MSKRKGKAPVFTDWEKQQLSSYAASVYLTYAGHASSGGLFEHEKRDMEKWKALADKLDY